MSERKVLNKYYPPDFDPTKIPKLKLPKDRQYVVRLMAPFNMRCLTCGEYIYKGKKFNARKETVQGETYLGILIFRFYIRCPRCISEITFKTDPENTDYTCENGATRNFQAHRMMAKQDEKLQQEKEEEEENNPMKKLENRTKESKQEMDILEKLEELRDLNTRQASVDYESLLEIYGVEEKKRKEREQQEDEDLVRSCFGNNTLNKRLDESESDDEDDGKGGEDDVNKACSRLDACAGSKRATDILTEDPEVTSPGPSLAKRPKASWEQSVGKLSNKSLSSLVKVKKISQTGGAKPAASGTQISQTGGAKPAASGTQASSSSNDTGPSPGPSKQGQSSHTDSNSLGLLGNYGSSSDESD